jgi:voltage-gated potassium channel Kch
VTLLASLAGVVLVVLVGIDVFRTVLMPATSGWAMAAASAGFGRLASAAPATVRAPARQAAGPAAVVAAVVVWLLALLAGFALLYLPHLSDLAYSSGSRTHGLADALYLSGTALTTLGFGDVVGRTPGIRLLTVVEAASGLGVLTATLGYLPAMYTLVSELRTANQSVADLDADAPDGAADLLQSDAALVLDAVRRDVLAARQHLQRFPVLHWFHPPYDESVVALARGATSLWVAGHFADSGGRPLHKHVEALERAIARLVSDLERHGGARPASTAVDARELFDRARAESPHPDAAAAAVVAPAAVDLLVHVHRVLDAYAERHGYSVLSAAADPCRAGEAPSTADLR